MFQSLKKTPSGNLQLVSLTELGVSMDVKKNRKDLIASLMNQLWMCVSGPVTLLLIPLFLTDVQQGYWYLFSSIAALNTFADLGFSNIILQFTAHEFAFLKLIKTNSIEGSNDHIKKIGSFFIFSLKWIAIVSLIVYPIIVTIGIIYFVRDGVVRVYLIPWLIYSAGSLIVFINGAVLSFLEGLNTIDIVQKIKFFMSVINTSIVVLLLIFHFNIFALSVGMLVSSSFMFICIFTKFKGVFNQLLREGKGYCYKWTKEVLPLFIKYAISAVTIFFTLYIYTPIMHLYHGPVYSGKVGMSFTIVNALFGISNIWIYTITPTLNMYVEKKEWKVLDKLFYKRVLLALFTYLGIILCMIVFWKFAEYFEIHLFQMIFSRCFPLWAIMFLAGAYLINVFDNAITVYLTAHKKIPLLIPNILSSLMIFVLTLIIGKTMKPEYFFLGTFITYVLFFPVVVVIFIVCKRSWHNE